MKRTVALLVIVTMLLQLAGCGTKEPYEMVIEKIDSIGTVTLDSRSKIKDAMESFDELSEDQKQEVSNKDELEYAYSKFVCDIWSEIEMRLESEDSKEAASYIATLNLEDWDALRNSVIIEFAFDAQNLNYYIYHKEGESDYHDCKKRWNSVYNALFGNVGILDDSQEYDETDDYVRLVIATNSAAADAGFYQDIDKEWVQFEEIWNTSGSTIQTWIERIQTTNVLNEDTASACVEAMNKITDQLTIYGNLDENSLYVYSSARKIADGLTIIKDACKNNGSDEMRANGNQIKNEGIQGIEKVLSLRSMDQDNKERMLNSLSSSLQEIQEIMDNSSAILDNPIFIKS